MILPTIGATGVYQFKAPFDKVVVSGERYTCQAIRRLSDYLANNETPLADIYVANGLTEIDYDADILTDMYIVSLQAAIGHWMQVPASYITTYPITNGIPYRSLMIGVALPPMPADRDLSGLYTSISNIVTDTIGVVPVIKPVETSKVILVDKVKSDLKQAERDALSGGKTTDRSRYMSVLNDLNNANAKIAALEKYIFDNHIKV